MKNTILILISLLFLTGCEKEPKTRDECIISENRKESAANNKSLQVAYHRVCRKRFPTKE